MFQNQIEDETPICPVCTVKCVPNKEALTEGQKGQLVQTPTGLWIIHSNCVTSWNEHAVSYQYAVENGYEFSFKTGRYLDPEGDD